MYYFLVTWVLGCIYCSAVSMLSSHRLQTPLGLRSRNIYLIGMTGSGKSTLARCYAPMVSYESIDTDSMIEELHGCCIRRLFTTLGEEAFRSVESSVLYTIEVCKTC